MSVVRQESRRLVELATPMVITQVSVMLMGVVDIMMVGHVGVDVLGAASLGRVWIFGTMLMGWGVVMGMDPIVTQAHGRRDAATLGRALQQGLVLASYVSILMAGLWFLTEPALILFRQDADLSRMAGDYVRVQIPSAPAYFFYGAVRQYLQGRAIVKPAMWVALGANVLNVVANWALIYGHLGFPSMGLVGAGLATTATRLFMFAALVFVVWRAKLYVGGWTGWTRKAWSVRAQGELLHYGLPVGLQLGLEVWAFEIATLFSGRLGNVELAAHIIALNLASLVFMVPLGVSQAATTRVGNLIGEGKTQLARTAAWIALAMGAGAMAIGAVIFIGFRHLLPRIYTDDPSVVALAALILPIAAAFQVFDGTQVVGSGILRGMGRTRPAAVFNLVGYYALALPLAWWLAFPRDFGVEGVWWGLALGLGTIAVSLVLWIWKRGPASDAIVIAPVAPERPGGP